MCNCLLNSGLPAPTVVYDDKISIRCPARINLRHSLQIVLPLPIPTLTFISHQLTEIKQTYVHPTTTAVAPETTPDA